MKKLMAGLFVLVMLGCPCGCVEAAETCVWSTLLQSVMTWLQQVGTTGGV